MKKFLYPFFALVLFFLFISPQTTRAAEPVYFSQPKVGVYDPLHAYVLSWANGDVLSLGGLNLTDLTFTTNPKNADVVINRYEDIGANAIYDLGPNASLNSSIDPAAYAGKWAKNNSLDLKVTTYLIRTHDYKYAKIRIDDIFANKVLFTYVMQTDAPTQETWKEILPSKTLVPPDKTWKIKLSNEVDPTSVNSQNVYVMTENATPVNVSVKVDPTDAKNILVQPPSGGYSYGKTYYVYVKNIKEKASSKLIKENVRMKFTIEEPIIPVQPKPPTNVSAMPYGDSIEVSWVNSTSSSIEGYYIYISTDGITYNKLRNLDDYSYIFKRNLVDITGYSGKTVYIYVTAVDKNARESIESSTVKVTPIENKPNPPTNIKAVPGNGEIELSWTKSSTPNIAGYYIYAKYEDGLYFEKLENVNNSPLFTGNIVKIPVTNGKKIYFYVTAVNVSGKESVNSDEISATAGSGSYPAPVINKVTPGNGTINIDWYEIYDPNLLGYYIYLSEGSTNNFTRLTYNNGVSLVTQTDQLIQYLKNNTKYYIYVSAVYKNNQTVDSTIVSATPIAVTSVDWSGTWKTDYGTMQLQQFGDTVVGSYNYGYVQGSITGTANGYKLTGKFSEPGNTGDIEFDMTSDKKEFLGMYRNQYQTIWAPWDGVRIK